MNEAWKSAAADAHHAKAEAFQNAIDVLHGVEDALAPIEQPTIRNAAELLERARDRHETAAKLQAVA